MAIRSQGMTSKGHGISQLQARIWHKTMVGVKTTSPSALSNALRFYGREQGGQILNTLGKGYTMISC